MPKVRIDGVTYAPVPDSADEIDKAMALLREVYGTLWIEAYYDGMSEQTRRFAQPLSDLMSKANKTLHFKD